jgi:hypothetical protein
MAAHPIGPAHASESWRWPPHRTTGDRRVPASEPYLGMVTVDMLSTGVDIPVLVHKSHFTVFDCIYLPRIISAVGLVRAHWEPVPCPLI